MNKYIIPALIALVISGSAGLFVIGKASQSNLRGLSERDIQTATLSVGTNPTTARPATPATKHLFGTCNVATTELPLEATSTDNFTCSASGVRSGDVVSVTLPSSSGSYLGGFVVGHASASTDSITFGILNQTGTASSSFPLATTSVTWEAWDN